MTLQQRRMPSSKHPLPGMLQQPLPCSNTMQLPWLPHPRHLSHPTTAASLPEAVALSHTISVSMLAGTSWHTTLLSTLVGAWEAR